MDISFHHLSPDTEDFPFIRITVTLHEQDTDELEKANIPLQSADFYVWVPKSDASLREIEAQALEKVKDFLLDAQKK